LGGSFTREALRKKKKGLNLRRDEMVARDQGEGKAKLAATAEKQVHMPYMKFR